MESSIPEKGELNAATYDEIECWRDKVFVRDHKGSLLVPSAILSNAIITLIAAVGPVSMEQLEALLEPRWVWWSMYGKELHAYLCTLPLEFKALRTKSGRKKGTQDLQDDAIEVPETCTLIGSDFNIIIPLATGPDLLYPQDISFRHCRYVRNRLRTHRDVTPHEANVIPSSHEDTVYPLPNPPQRASQQAAIKSNHWEQHAAQFMNSFQI